MSRTRVGPTGGRDIVAFGPCLRHSQLVSGPGRRCSWQSASYVREMEKVQLEIAWLEIADPPDLWRELGYAVDKTGVCLVGGIAHRLVGANPDQRGLVRWGLAGLDPETEMIDGIPSVAVEKSAVVHSDQSKPGSPPLHTNLVTSIDHLVIQTGSTPRTATALEAIGLERRGRSDSTSSGEQVHMTFFWIGATLLEIVGPPIPKPEAKPARLMGIAYVSSDLDRTATHLGDLCSAPKAAVQPGRRIAALRSAAGSTMPMAFMTPHPKSGSS